MMRLNRRHAIASGVTLAALSALPARAASLTVPQVDALTLTIVDDKEVFGPFLPNLDLPGLQVMRSGNGGGPVLPRMLPNTLEAEFGLSILGESRIGAVRRRVLVDFGYSREVLANNLKLLGIDAASIDAAVLSHGHLDHYGGWPGLFGGIRPARPLPLYVGGEEIFCERTAMIGNPPPIMGTLDKAALTAAGFGIVEAPDPRVVAGQAFTTGLIPLTGFERAAIPTRMHPGKGCALAGLNPAKREQTDLADDGEHELATVYAVKGLGLVVIASCSHRGVLNSIRQAQAVSGIQQVHMVIGGFHLVRPRTEDEARRTVAEMAQINPRYVVPGHCTGETFIEEAMRGMPGKIIRPYVGTRFTMGAAT